MSILTKYNTPHVSDNIRYGISEFVNGANGDGDYVVCEVPRGALVTVKAVEVTTAFSGTSTGTLTIGYKERGSAIQASGFAADSVTLSEATGVKAVNTCKHFPKGGVITIGVTKGDSSANIVARAYFEYTIICV